jgi:hypothetical protein
LFAAAACEEQKQPETAEQEKDMKSEEIKSKAKEAIDYLIRSLESGHSEVLSQYLSAMAHFPDYSFGNIMLIARQCPTATQVCGLRTWNALGRFVKRGEKGILILAPMVRGGRQRLEESILKDSSGDEHSHRLIGFRAVYVFDISQTEGEDLPTLTDVEGSVGNYTDRLRAFVEDNGIKLLYSDTIAPAKGTSQGGIITLLPGLQPAEEFATLAHEVGHEMLHRGERRAQTTKRLRETEAEAVAFVVSRSIGLQTGSASADYIQLYNGDAELLQQSLEAVLHSAAAILRAISPEVPTLDATSSPRTIP